MHDWSKESLHLAVGDWIIWQDAEIKSEDGFAIVSLGMKGQVISLHDGFHMDLVQEGSVPPKALVRFESGISLLVDQRMKWEKLTEERGAGPRPSSQPGVRFQLSFWLRIGCGSCGFLPHYSALCKVKTLETQWRWDSWGEWHSGGHGFESRQLHQYIQ